MPIKSVNAVTNLEMAPELQRAQEAVQLPEVREMMKRLAEYHLGICMPHMHRPDIDFDVLPDDLVQVEENCVVRWVPRSELITMNGHVPVAWRWTNNGTVEDADCIQTCTPTDNGHRTGHL